MSGPRFHQMTIKELEERFDTNEACKTYLAACRWPDGARCARCGAEKPYDVGDFRWQCHQCHDKGYRFSVLVGTIFENTKLPLATWFKVIHWMCVSKKASAPFRCIA